MKIKSLGLKVSLIVSVMIALIVILIVIIVSMQSTTLVDKLVAREARSANGALAKELDTLQKGAAADVLKVASSQEIVNAMLTGNSRALAEAIDIANEDFDIVLVCDSNGVILAQNVGDNSGESLMNNSAVSSALSTGTGQTGITRHILTGQLSVSASSAIRDRRGTTIGVVLCAYDLSDLRYVDEVKAFVGSEITLFDGDTRLSSTITNDSGERVVGTKASETVIETVINQKRDLGLQINLFGHEYFAHYSPLIVDGEVVGMLFAGVRIDEALADQQTMMNLVVTVGIIAGLVCIALILLFNVFAVSRPLKKIGLFARKIREGDIGVTSETAATIDVRSSDEVGMVARELETAYAQLRGYVGEIQARMRALADGDLATESTYKFDGDFILIKEAINDHIQNLSRTMAEINNSSAQVAAGSKQIANGAQSLAQGSTEQASSVEELSATITEINSMARDNSENSTIALSDVQKTENLMSVCTGQMIQMLNAMKTIDEKSKDILKTTKVIDDIAFQTNILALNAAVEAARAGQHGKGFAVVAEEVRNLASKSAEAAKETASLLESSSQSVGEGSEIVTKVNESLRSVAEIAHKNAETIEKLQTNSVQQSGAMEQVAIGIDQVAQVIQQNSATAEESAAASEEMSGQSDVLLQLVTQFKLANDGNVYEGLPAGRPSPKRLAHPRKEEYNYAVSAGDFGKY